MTLKFQKKFTKDEDVENLFKWKLYENKYEFPDTYSDNACSIVSSKYFWKGSEEHPEELSLKDMVSRIVNTITSNGINYKYFDENQGLNFNKELKYVLYNQMGAFNSPVQFNIGIKGRTQTSSACFINSIDDTMESILENTKIEGLIFKEGSGCGVNLSTLRGSQEALSGGGKSSGPLSFMKGFDAFASVILSGGRTRRAARMVLLDIDHPDIEEFIACKAKEEKIVEALVQQGYSNDFTDPEGAYSIVRHQSGNNSIRISNEFMELLNQEDDTWCLRERVSGNTMEISAKKLFKQLAEAAWKCGDPGVMFGDNVNEYHTCKENGEIISGNPCQEFVFIDNSACNLASLNLIKFSTKPKEFDFETFSHVINLFITAQDILVEMSHFPTEQHTKNSRDFRPLGLGLSNLGGLLMSWGLAYNSDISRNWTSIICSWLTGEAYSQSMRMAKILGSFKHFESNIDHVKDVLHKHFQSTKQLNKPPDTLINKWKHLYYNVEKSGLRNAQTTLMAPTGTIGIMMDCATLGIEPEIGLKKTKKLIEGTTMKMVNPLIGDAAKALGFNEEQIEVFKAYLEDKNTLEGLPELEPYLHVFDCSLPSVPNGRYLSVNAHVKMCAAIQPFISGAISKTYNMPNDATVQDVEQILKRAWEYKLKGITIYRSGSKLSEPLETSGRTHLLKKHAVRERLPDTRSSITHRANVGGSDLYFTVGAYPDGRPGELFVEIPGYGSTLSGLLDGFGTLVSLAFQHGIPLETLAKKFTRMKFEPSGITHNPEIPTSGSLLAYIFKWLTLAFPEEVKEETKLLLNPPPICSECNNPMTPSGACFTCSICGTSSGVCS